MKKTALAVCIALAFLNISAQQSGIDSTLRLLKQFPDDTAAVSRNFFVAASYHFLHKDSLANEYLIKSVAMAVKHNRKHEELVGKFLLINANNPAASLSRGIECLRLAESIRDTIGIINAAFRINLIYTGAEEFGKALGYSRTMLNVSSASHDSVWQWNGLYSIANAFINLQKADSGLYYAQEAYRFALGLSDFTQRWLYDSYYQYPRPLLIAWSLHALGRAEQLLNDDELATNYFHKGLAFANSVTDDRSASMSIYSSMAASFLRRSAMDSVIKYCRLYLTKETILPDVIQIYMYLAKAYEGKNSDSSVAYYKLAAEKREAYFTTQSRSAITDLTSQEDERRNALLQFNAEVKSNRNRNLQLSFLGIGLITFCILYLLISQTIIVKSGLVRFLGVLALLLVFEFINLFLHPVIENFTHHSQLWMFMIMVSIAALLIPAHHKLEKWITTQMVAKNKRIRLEAAKKTIKTLEG